MSNTLEETLDEWNESDMLMRWPPEFLKIVGKHSTLWNHSKGETLLLIDEWLQERILSEAHKIALEAIGTDYPVEENEEDHTKVTLRWINNVKGEQRQRLSKITGVKE